MTGRREHDGALAHRFCLTRSHQTSSHRRLSCLVLSSLVLLGCSPGDPTASDPTAGDSLASPIDASLVVEGLDRPTQLFIDGDNWLVAQLGGSENEQLGQVLLIDPQQPEQPVVLVEGLNKPTGVARFAGDLWVMEADRLLRFDLADPAAAGSPARAADGEVAAGPLPNNGRSEGTLTVVGDRLLFDTSGSLSDGSVVAESGRLWSIDGDGVVAEVASGFKHAYAHTPLADGSILVTEIGDGRLDGSPPADAVMRLVEGADHGWPACVPKVSTLERRPIEEFGGTSDQCAVIPPLLAVFEIGATPTSVAVLPWDQGTVAVALWGRAEIVAVGLESGATTLLISQSQLAAVVDAGGEPRPQHLVVDGERLLVVDFEEGRVYALAG